ncbi:MAG TPA: aldo/keto reductase [Candidatus Bathyarchaeia archaeon]|nr:aldo/keto reductase [Candidatus Bathyarchaeia archaeon]
MAQVTSHLDLESRVKLNNGVEMPVLGLGVYQSPPGRITQRAVSAALDIGYRHIDTARIYDNESDVGKALKQTRVSRKEIFVTTKLWNSDQGHESTLHACNESLRRLGVSSLDLYLIHWPVPKLRTESWKAMTELLKQGKCRSIGVSNFTIDHLEDLLKRADIVPAVNQVEFHPFLYQKKLLEYCRNKGIQLEAYAPLTRGERLDHPVVLEVARKYAKTSAQVLIRWTLQHGIVVIPKSVKPERIRENSKVFDFNLSEADMRKLDSLNEDLRTCWDPTGTP